MGGIFALLLVFESRQNTVARNPAMARRYRISLSRLTLLCATLLEIETLLCSDLTVSHIKDLIICY
jgi:hypothetical protein